MNLQAGLLMSLGAIVVTGMLVLLSTKLRREWLSIISALGALLSMSFLIVMMSFLIIESAGTPQPRTIMLDKNGNCLGSYKATRFLWINFGTPLTAPTVTHIRIEATTVRVGKTVLTVKPTNVEELYQNLLIDTTIQEYLTYNLYEFEKSTELDLFYNPLDKEQQKEFHRLVSTYFSKKLELVGLELVKAKFVSSGGKTPPLFFMRRIN